MIHRKILFTTTLVLLASFSLFCDNSSGKAKDREIPEYHKPIIQNDSFFKGSHWNDPHVLYINGEFIMYASSDLAWDGFVKLYRLTSTDGVNWSLNPSSPVLEKSVSGWDSRCTETPAVVYFQGNYHLFYTGYDVHIDYTSKGDDGKPGTTDDDLAPKHFKIGHAVSADGIHFTKREFVAEPTSPYTYPNLDFNQYIVAEPGPVVFNDKIYLYFTAVGAAPELETIWQTIGLMIFDGTNWDSPRRVLTPDLTLYPRITKKKYIGYSTPNAVIINNRVHLYCDVALESPWTQVKIHHASSTDGETGWVQDSAPLLKKEDYPWTTAEIRSPSALVYNNKLYLYFAGHVKTPAPNLAIGLKIFDL